MRQHLEYCTQVWASWYKNTIDLLEWVQQMASEMFWGWSTSHEESLRELVCSAWRGLQRVLPLSTGTYRDSVEKIEPESSWRRIISWQVRDNLFQGKFHLYVRIKKPSLWEQLNSVATACWGYVNRKVIYFRGKYNLIWYCFYDVLHSIQILV